jgi:hypothetical protein
MHQIVGGKCAEQRTTTMAVMSPVMLHWIVSGIPLSIAGHLFA